MLELTNNRNYLSNQLWSLAELHEQLASQLDKLEWHSDLKFEKCLMAISAKTLCFYAEDIKYEAKPLGFAEKPVTLARADNLARPSLSHTLGLFYTTVLMLNAKYIQLKQESYSAMTLELLTRASYEVKNLSYMLIVLLERLRFYESSVGVNHAVMAMLEVQARSSQSLN